MPTLRECITELRARQARLDEAVKGGWRDAIPSEQESVNEMRYALDSMLEQNMDALLEAAGDLDLGELPIGICLAHSTPYTP